MSELSIEDRAVLGGGDPHDAAVNLIQRKFAAEAVDNGPRTDSASATRSKSRRTADPEHDVLGHVVMRDVAPRNARWLWPGYVALEMPTVLAGPGGVGKSTILYDLASRVTRDGGGVLVATAEDHLEIVVRPRLQAANADLDHVFAVTDSMVLPGDVERLAALAKHRSAVLVIVDPLVAFLAAKVDTHRDSSVRQALAPLAALAERTGCAVVSIVHTNKAVSDDPLFRLGGSGAFGNAARHVLLAAADPDDDEAGTRRVLAVVKSNIAVHAPPISYEIVSADVLDDAGNEIATSRIAWGDELPSLDPRSLLRAPTDPEERREIDRACDFLGGVLADGPRLRRDVEAAADAEKISVATLKRAKGRLGVISEQVRNAARVTGWRWRLPRGSATGQLVDHARD